MLSIFKKILGTLLLFAPVMAFATTVSPGGGNNAWDIYTMGNGTVIVQILQATIAIIGNSSYRNLLLLVASGGFLFLAVQAGFDFGKNFMKMFVYIFVVFLVLKTSTSITMNVQVDDEVKQSFQGVSNVPVVVGFPAATITGVGHWLAQNIATAFGVDPMLSVSGGSGGSAGGGFNIFGDMMEDANNYIITDQSLKSSLAAYTGDCVVAAMGMGILQPSAMQASPNLWTTFSTGKTDNTGTPGAAIPQAVMTRYYYPVSPGASLPSSTSCSGSAETFAPSGSGTIVSCPTAYACLTNDLANHAQGLLSAKQTQWATTGAVTPYATAFQAAIEQASGGNNSGGAITPQSLVQQEALINEMHGSFRSAAAQTGDNSLLISANVASAEQSQKSAFYVGSLVAEHMAGYIFTVLQAFLFALVPIIIVASLIPGLGRQVAVSFIQMLVWLALWEPMYEIVNFLILAFSSQSVGLTFSTWNGPTMGNQYTMSEQTSNLVAAARMLGSSVPILALGLVKGGIALEKFAADTLGAEWGKSAGQNAATGSYSEGGIKLASVDGGKYNTASESVVGTSGTSVKLNSGALTGETDYGGGKGMQGGQTIGESYSSQAQHQEGRALQSNAAVGNSGGANNAAGNRMESGVRSENSRNYSTGSNASHNESQSNGINSSQDAGHRNDASQQSNQQHSASYRDSNSADARLGGGISDKGNFGKPSANSPMDVNPVGGGAGALAGAGGGAVGAGGAGAGAALPGAAGQTFKNGHQGIGGDMSFSGNQSMGRSIDSGMSATTTAGQGSSGHYGSSMSMQSGLQHGDSYGSSASAGHNMSSGSSSSSGHNADSNHTYSSTAGMTSSASGNTGDTTSTTRTTSGGGMFLQGNYEQYQGDTHFGDDGYWDRAAAADSIKQEFLSGMSADQLKNDGFQAQFGSDWAAAHNLPSDPGPGAIPGADMSALAEPASMSAGWTSGMKEFSVLQDGVKKQASNTQGGVIDMQNVLGSKVHDPIPGVTMDLNPASATGATLRYGFSTADKLAFAGEVAGGASLATSEVRHMMASRGASQLSSKVNP